jgi:lipopolysaccharide cholinephosphotransferase
MDTDILSKLHQVELEILDELVSICEKHNLTYFLVGGTLLGAARHKGFIPWDDDIDVSMPREDYQQFITICRDELDNKYFLHDISTDPRYWLPFIKLRKNNTCFLEEEAPPLHSGDHRGIAIDIFPYDGVRNHDPFWKIKEILIRKIRHLLPIKLNFKIEEKHFYAYIKRFMAGMFSFHFLHWLLKRIMTPRIKNYKYITSWTGMYGYQRETFPADFFTPVAKLPFEDRLYNAPREWELYLKQIYGDYMKLPPEDKRKTHKPQILSFDSSETP